MDLNCYSSKILSIVLKLKIIILYYLLILYQNSKLNKPISK
nr:MAG TPA: hypothetical protein [Caudoviricetes sp.]